VKIISVIIGRSVLVIVIEKEESGQDKKEGVVV
jgi:hypothetical protein